MEELYFSRHSRTILTIGKESYLKIQNSKIFLIGLNPLGVEIAKSLLLMGINELFIFDNDIISKNDISSCFFYNNNQIGKNKCDILIKSLNYLNPNSKIIQINNKYEIENFDLIILSESSSFEVICNFNLLCRKFNKGFIYTDQFSYSGYIFIDFINHIIFNDNSEEPLKFKISFISNSNPGIIKFFGKKNQRIPKNILFKFYELESMIELNNLSPFYLNKNENNEYIIFNTLNFSKFNELNPTGYIQEFKKPIYLNHKDYSKISELNIIPSHISNENKEEIKEFYLKKQNFFKKELNYNCIISTFIGSIVVNESIKYLTQNLIPLENQLFVYKKNSLFNQENKLSLLNQKICLIGVGAIGCEFAKIASTFPFKQIDLIDSDIIEETNLNRQMLFNENDINKNKAICAKNILNLKNNNIIINSYENFIDNNSIHQFDYNYFSQFDSIFPLVDSFHSRYFISNICLKCNKPMFTAGIGKFNCDFEVIIPKITPKYQYYSSNTESSPSCTLKSFPYKPLHCIEWGYNQLKKILNLKYFISLEDIFNFTINFYLDKFIYFIKDLIYFHPKNEISNGIPYWGEHRIFPNPLIPNLNDKYQFLYFKSLILILLEINKILIPNNLNNLILNLNIIDEWIPKKEIKIKKNIKNINLIEIDKNNINQMNFIFSISNLRSLNYNIGEINSNLVFEFSTKVYPTITILSSISASLCFIEYLSYLIDINSTLKGNFFSKNSNLVLFSHGLILKKKLGKTNNFFDEWDFFKYNSKTSIKDIIKDLEEKVNGKLISWSLENGQILSLNEKNFKYLFKNNKNNNLIIIEPFFNFNDNKEYDFPQILINN